MFGTPSRENDYENIKQRNKQEVFKQDMKKKQEDLLNFDKEEF